MNDNGDRVWLVKETHSYDNPEYHVEPFAGGALADPFASGLLAIYRTEQDAREAVVSAHETYTYSAGPVQPRKPTYENIIAWLVTFIILSNESGDAKYHVQGTSGGQLRWNDDRDVIAIFMSQSEADAWAAAKSLE